jgi:hypothetical protein
MKSTVQAFLSLLLVIEPIVGYAQTPEAQSVPSVSGISSASTSQAPQITENTPAQPTTAAPLLSTPQTERAPDSPQPAAAPPPAKRTKAKPNRHHLSGFDIGIFVFSGLLLIILLGAVGGR